MKIITNIDARIRKASIDPFYTLAQELTNECVTELDLIKRFQKFPIEDYKKTKLLNYMRDIRIKKDIDNQNK